MPTLVEKLTTVQAQIEQTRGDRAGAIAERDRLKSKLEAAATIDRNSPDYKAARAAASKASEAGNQLTALQSEENELLVLLGRSDETQRTNGNGPEDGVLAASDLESLKKPGQLLSAMLERRKADVTTLPQELRTMAAATPITTDQISTAVETNVLIDLFSPLSVAMASGIQVLPITGTETKIPRFLALPVADWIPELGAFPKSGPGIERVTVKPPKVGLVTPLSIEVFEDLTPLMLSMLQTQLLRAVALAYDRGILFGDPDPADPTDVTPRGVAHTTGIALVDDIPLTNLAAFAESIAVLLAENASAGALAMNPLDVGALLKLTESAEGPGSNVPLWKASVNSPSGLRLPYFDVPIWPTPAAPQGEALLYDPSTVLAVIRREADISIDPYYDFDNGEVGLRVYLRGDVVVGQPAGAVRIIFAPPPAPAP